MSNYVAVRDGGKSSEEGLMKPIGRLFTAGVPTANSTTSLLVVQRAAGANMSVDISIGDTALAATGYTYWGWSDAVNNVVIVAADPTNPRIDAIVAYVDLSVVSSASNNNPGALKFVAIVGSAAVSPVVASDATIQAAVGALNPFTKIATVAVAALTGNIVNANITDIRAMIAFKGKLYGGANNTTGHTVPNVVDKVVALTGDATGKTDFVSLLSTIFSGQVLTQVNAGTAGGSMFYINLGGIKLLWGKTSSQSIPLSTSSNLGVTFPVSFFTTIQSMMTTIEGATFPAAIWSSLIGLTPTSTNIVFNNTNTGGSVSWTTDYFVIGT